VPFPPSHVSATATGEDPAIKLKATKPVAAFREDLKTDFIKIGRLPRAGIQDGGEAVYFFYGVFRGIGFAMSIKFSPILHRSVTSEHHLATSRPCC
jgi:hypothetical protein